MNTGMCTACMLAPKFGVQDELDRSGCRDGLSRDGGARDRACSVKAEVGTGQRVELKTSERADSDGDRRK